MAMMQQQKCKMPYDEFALFYNNKLGNFAERLVPVLDEMLLKKLPAGARILDVCCGTGQLASRLGKLGYNVIGVDESSEMLHLARDNAPDAEFFQAKANAFDLDTKVDAVVSTFDSINHILDINEVEEVFSCIHKQMVHDGYFIFDVNMEEGYLSRWDGQWRGEFGQGTYNIKAEYDAKARLGHNVISIDKSHNNYSNQWKISERCYSKQELSEALNKAGFCIKAVYDGHDDLGLFGEWGRSFYVCQKMSANVTNTVTDNKNTDNKSEYRTVQICISDGVYPNKLIVRELGDAGLRLKAINEVLCRLKPSYYDQLLKQASLFTWFVPSLSVLGQVHPFTINDQMVSPDSVIPPHVRVIYLSPFLEQQVWPVVVIAVAHELVHVILKHEIVDPDADTYERQEREVRQKLQEWGFKEELISAESTIFDWSPMQNQL